MAKTHTTGILWFRRDLRVDDNPALQEALAACETVLPVYIDDHPTVTHWPDGAASRWWLHHSLTALHHRLAAMDSTLVLRSGDAHSALESLCRATGATAVFWNRRYEPAGRDHDTALKASLTASGIDTQSSNGSLLNEPWTVLTGGGTPYRVFTPYWKRARQQVEACTPLPAPATLPLPGNVPESPSIESLQLLPSIDWDDGLEATWTPGTEGARARLATFLGGPIEDYADGRNLPGSEGVSRLSPHLHFGEMSVREVWQQVHDCVPAGDGRETFLAELGWREFAHYVLYHFPHTADEPMNEKYAAFDWNDDETLIEAWRRGRTGVPIVDAGMRQLWTSGWMHNRVRMVVASFLVKNIRAHWLHGARWFWDTLVDADLPANSLGWQWSAGCGADAAPYFRVFNPVRQGERFDPAGDYVRRWVPEIAAVPDKYVHAPWTLPEKLHDVVGFTPGRDYPHPIVDLKQSREAALAAFRALQDAA